MIYIILPNLQLVLFFVYLVIENFNKTFIFCLAINSIIVYCTNIITNKLNKVANCIKFSGVKNWSI